MAYTNADFPTETTSRRHIQRARLGMSAAILTAGVFGPALAQQQAQVMLEEIVVTARRQAENLQQVPLQVSAFTTDMLRSSVTVGLRDLNNLAPGLNYQGNIGRQGTGRVFFRGLNAGSSTAASSAKGSIFLDGVYFASSAQDIPFDYFERIEVMPGPQSALFGRATFGGAMNYVTKDPTDEVSGRLSVDVATLGEYSFNGFVAGPLMEEKLLGSLMLSYQDFDGPEDYKTPPDVLHPNGVKQNGTTTYFGAAKFVFNPADDVRIEAHIMRNKDVDDPYAFFRSRLERRNGQFVQPNGTINTYPIGVLKVKEEFNGRRVGGYPLFVANYYNIPDPRRRTESWRPSVQATWTVQDHDVQLNFFHEYEWWKEGGGDSDFAIVPFTTTLDRKQLTESKSAEFTVFSPRDQRLRYKFGGYLLKSTLDITVTTFSTFRCNTAVTPTALQGCQPTSPAAIFNPVFVPSAPGSAVGTFPGFTGVIQRLNTVTPTNSTNGVKNRSVFGSVSYDFTDDITGDFEARYQGDRVWAYNNLAGGFRGIKTFKAFLPRVNLQYKFNDDEAQVYALFSLGNNPGGFNASPFIGAPGTNTTEADHRNIPEEKLYNYEAGLKARWYDGRLVTNITVYHMQWKNQTTSVTFPDPLRNATLALLLSQGNSRVNGLAAEVSAAPAEGWNLRGTLSYTGGKYKRWCSTNLFFLTGVATPGRLGCVDVSGNATDSVPPWSGSMNVSYTAPLSGDWNWVARGTFQYQDGMWESDMNLLKSEVGYIFNLTFGVETENLNFEAYCYNCTQEVAPYRIVRLLDPRAGPNNATNVSFTGTPRKPRQFGIRSVYDF
jgi:outer membrane receptor protein involved in Fe transport